MNSKLYICNYLAVISLTILILLNNIEQLIKIQTTVYDFSPLLQFKSIRRNNSAKMALNLVELCSLQKKKKNWLGNKRQLQDQQNILEVL